MKLNNVTNGYRDWLAGVLLLLATCLAPAQTPPPGEQRIIIQVIQGGSIDLRRKGASDYVETNLAQQELYPGDRLRTRANSRVTVRWSDQSQIEYGPNTEIEILPPHATGAEPGLRIFSGLISFFHRGEPGRIRILTRATMAGINGTEFTVRVEPDAVAERTTVSLIDGVVELTGAFAPLTLTNHEQAIVTAGQAPRRTAGFIANNVLQWCFYYPAVLDVAELPLTPAETNLLSASLAAYREGDLLTALARFPAAPGFASAAVRLYHSALLLAVGQIDPTESDFAGLTAGNSTNRLARLAGGLRTLLAAVREETNFVGNAPELATELLAASYLQQSRTGNRDSLTKALRLAREATVVSPGFSFAWARLAQLEFSFGRVPAARAALFQALSLAPANAEALALEGFLLAAEDHSRAALAAFDRALAVDSGLANAWLGRGLCRLRRGDVAGGRSDLLTAATLEPQRSALRSYLGKAYAEAGDTRRAGAELRRARELDPNDPTVWLYAALLEEQENRFNDSVRDLEQSQVRNDNRGVYRSQFLLDQDRAVRSANLARVYNEAGLADVAQREAGRAVAADYSSYGAHLFLANTFDLSRNATPYGNRYDTLATSEYLLASLLGPSDPRFLAQPISQQEYTRLFERDGMGISSSTEYLSRGAWNQYGAQYGSFAGTSYAIEGAYQSDPGQAPNSGFTRSDLSAKIKQAVTPADSFLLQVSRFKLNGGDLAQHYEPNNAVLGQTLSEKQSPDLLLGYHHEWSPESHTLVLAGRVDDRVVSFNPHGYATVVGTFLGDPDVAAPVDITRLFERHYTANSLELQQQLRWSDHQIIFGARGQLIKERITDRDTVLPDNFTAPNGYSFLSYVPFTPYGLSFQEISTTSRRGSIYAYDFWQLSDDWQIFGGLTADRLELGANNIAPPLTDDRVWSTHFSPKLAVRWSPTPAAVLIAGYARSVTGQDVDQNFSLEPSHMFGLPVNFRTAFPNSLSGAISGERMEIWQADGRLRLGRDVYLVMGVSQLSSRASQRAGAYVNEELASPPDPQAIQVTEELRFKEQSAHLSLRRLVGDNFSLGGRYEFAKAALNQDYGTAPAINQFNQGNLQTLTFDALAYSRRGFFSQVKATRYLQSSLRDSNISAGLPEADFWQLDAMLGYRSPHRHFEINLGILNLTDQNYRLSPINFGSVAQFVGNYLTILMLSQVFLRNE